MEVEDGIKRFFLPLIFLLIAFLALLFISAIRSGGVISFASAATKNYTGEGTYELFEGDRVFSPENFSIEAGNIFLNRVVLNFYRPYNYFIGGVEYKSNDNFASYTVGMKVKIQRIEAGTQKKIVLEVAYLSSDLTLDVKVRDDAPIFKQGEEISASQVLANVSVRNIGELDAGNFDVTFAFQKDREVQRIYTKRVALVKAGNSTSVDFSDVAWTPPASFAGLPKSYYKIRIVADPGNLAVESNEKNNAFEVLLKIDGLSKDLVIAATTTTTIAPTPVPETTTTTIAKRKPFIIYDYSLLILAAIFAAVSLGVYYYLFIAEKKPRKRKQEKKK